MTKTEQYRLSGLTHATAYIEGETLHIVCELAQVMKPAGRQTSGKDKFGNPKVAANDLIASSGMIQWVQTPHGRYGLGLNVMRTPVAIAVDASA